jgi:alpha-L-fucosidase
MKHPNLEKFKSYKFGMFIHWGLYAISGNSEWGIMFDNNSMNEFKNQTLPHFDGKNCNTDEWAELAKNIGCRYMVFTARHHDGFSLFDSKHSWGNFTSMNSPAKRDFVKEYVDSCRKYGLGVGIYYSPIDWRFPGFYNPKMFKENAQEMVEQCHQQVNELTSNYGDIDLLWYDGGEDFVVAFGIDFGKRRVPEDYRTNPKFKDFWREDELDAMARKNQPNIVVSPRIGSMKHGDFKVYECKINNYDVDSPWETCDRVAGSWGWTQDVQPKSLRSLIKMLIRVVTGGGNLLLNIGPDPSCKLEPCQKKRLLELGEFVNTYGESIFDTTAGPIVNGEYGGTTHNKHSVYLHITEWKCDKATFPTLNAKVKSVECLTPNDGFTYEEKDGILIMSVSDNTKLYHDTIFKITFEDEVDKIFEGYDPESFKIDNPPLEFNTFILGDENG